MKTTLKTTLSALVLLAAFATPTTASAQAADRPLAGNISLVSDYRFRGISQSYKLPALQGGLDWSHASGLYLGNWNSSLSGNQYPNGASLEMDFYGGYKFALTSDITLDAGGIYYLYPGAYWNGFLPTKPKFNNFEVYLGASSGPFSAKLYVAVTDFFGLDSTTGGKDSSGSYYLDLNYGAEIMPKLSLSAHLGYQNVRNYTSGDNDLSYFDYKLGITYDWSGWALGAAVVGTNADKKLYVASDAAGKVKRTGEPGLVLSIGKSF